MAGMQPGVFIDNAFAAGKGAKFISRDPATDAVIWSGKSASRVDVHLAVQSARKAFPSWARLPVGRRSDLLNKFAQVLKARKGALAETISRDTGKPLWESETEVDTAVNKAALAVEAYAKRCADETEGMGDASRATHFKPDR